MLSRHFQTSSHFPYLRPKYKHMIRTAFLFLSFVLTSSILSFAQQTMDVTLKLTYNNFNLCHWNVDLKHGDLVLARGVSDKNGEVHFASVTLASRDVDASGKKNHSSGEKSWNARGYITLDENGYGSLDFSKLVEESGAPKSMMENAWGLTLDDCGGTSTPSGTSPGATLDEAVDVPAEASNPQVAGSPKSSDPRLIRVTNLKGELELIERKLNKLKTAASPVDALMLALHEAEIAETQAKFDWKTLELSQLEDQMSGSFTVDRTGEVAALKAAFEEARDSRKELQKQVKASNKGIK